MKSLEYRGRGPVKSPLPPSPTARHFLRGLCGAKFLAKPVNCFGIGECGKIAGILAFEHCSQHSRTQSSRPRRTRLSSASPHSPELPARRCPAGRTDLSLRPPAASFRRGRPRPRPRPRPASSLLWTGPLSPTPARSRGTWPRPSSCDSPLATRVPPPPPPTPPGAGPWPHWGLRSPSRSL